MYLKPPPCRPCQSHYKLVCAIVSCHSDFRLVALVEFSGGISNLTTFFTGNPYLRYSLFTCYWNVHICGLGHNFIVLCGLGARNTYMRCEFLSTLEVSVRCINIWLLHNTFMRVEVNSKFYDIMILFFKIFLLKFRVPRKLQLLKVLLYKYEEFYLM